MSISRLNPASISALAAIFGSLAGALASSVSAWITQRHQDRRDLVAKRIFHREQLYSDFISESARAFADAFEHSFRDTTKLVPTYALLSRIRLSSSDEVLRGLLNALLIASRYLFSAKSHPRGNSLDGRQSQRSATRVQWSLSA